jgi:3-hydroxybutyryl-CoA dehydratase
MTAAQHGFWLETLEIGQAAEAIHVVTEHDVQAFAALSGDSNPLHLDDAFAETTPFKGRVAHGMLSGAFISAVLGTELPGPGAIYVSQSLDFKRPVRIGDAVVTRVEVTGIDEAKGRVTLSTVCRVNRKIAVDGEAVVLVARRAESAEAA